MDLGTIFGFIGTWLLILATLLLGGSLMTYVDIPSVILVFGASFTVLFFAIPAKQVKVMVSVTKKAFFYKPMAIDKLIEDLVSFAEIARRDGILSLENAVKDIDDPFVVQGIQMAVDGTDPELIEQIMLKNAAVKRLIDPSEVASLVGYLASDAAGAVTGASWNIDLGWTAQ